MRKLLILVGCEESQAITKSFRELGHEAFSCDLLPCSGGHPEWHLQMDIFEAIKLKKWDLAILHPECTYMSVSGLFRNINNPMRSEKTEKSLNFVCDIINLAIKNGIKYIAVENPVSCISTRIYLDTDLQYKVIPIELKSKFHIKPFKASQTIQPYEFGDDASKRTCLWLINLPKLKRGVRYNGRIVDGKERWSNQTDSGQNKLPPSDNRAKIRSKTYDGIAKAISKQWSEFILSI